MKTASIYSSQKQQSHNQLLYQHHNQVNPNSLTPNPYHHSGSTTSVTKKSSTMKKFEYCINANTIQNVKTPKQNHYHFLNQIGNSSNNNTMVMKPKKPTQKPIHNVQKNVINYFVKQYQKIISNLTDYYKYYEWMLMKEIEKHDLYYNDLIKVIEAEKKRSQIFLMEQVKTLSEKILLQKAALQNKIALLENNNLKHYEKEKIELESQRFLELPLFEVGLRKIEKFRSQIRKFLFEVKTQDEIQRENSLERESLEEMAELTQSVKTQKKSCSEYYEPEVDQMTPINPQPLEDSPPYQPPTPKAGTPTIPLQDQYLYCDQDIQKILKSSKVLKKKRYDFRQDAIPQQSQSHEDSLNISNIKSIN